MSPLSNAQIDALLAGVTHLYPVLELPTDRQTRDIGHTCLAYLDTALPRRELMLHSYLHLLYAQTHAGLRYLSDAEFLAWKAVYPPSMEWQALFWKEIHTQNATIEAIKSYKVSGCGELAKVTYDWLRAQGVNAHQADCFFFNGEKPDDQHRFVLYTLPNTPALSFDEMMRDLTNPNVRVCDAWLQRCGTVAHMFNYYADTFVVVKNKKYLPITDRLPLVVVDMGNNAYFAGRVRVTDAGKSVRINLNPPCQNLVQRQKTIDNSGGSFNIKAKGREK